MRIRTILAAAAAPAALAAALLGTAGQASAATATKPVTITASTHLNNHPDTTSFLPGYPLPAQDATTSSPDGPVWAYDNANEKFTLVQQSDGTWVITMDYVGSFHGFADPTKGNALTSDGSVKGTIQFTASDPGVMPNPALLPAQTSGSITDNIEALFGGTATIGGGNVYNFNYQNGNYVQNQPANGPYVQTGDVTGH
jgi:hypothetical protein